METVDATPPPAFAGAPAAVTVNKEELTRALGCSPSTLDRLIERYPDFPIERRGHEGVGYEFDPEKVDAFLTKQREAEEIAAADRTDLLSGLDLTSVGGDEPTGLTPNQELAAVRARIARLELAKKEGFLVDVSAVRMKLTPPMQALARFLDGLPDRMGRRFYLPVGVIDAMRAEMEEERRQLRASIDEPTSQEREDAQLALGA